MNQDTPNPAANQPGRRQVKLEVPANLRALYVNFAMITNTQSEVIFDFAQALPNMPKVEILARLLLSPTSAKQFHKALGDMLAKYESTYGEIKVPPTLADRLFQASRFPSTGEEPEGEGGNEQS